MGTTNRYALDYFANGQGNPGATLSAQANLFDAAAGGATIIQRDLNAPPGSPSDGDLYGTGTSPTGAWAGEASKLALYQNGWLFYSIPEGFTAYDQANDIHIKWSPDATLSEWTPVQRWYTSTEHWTGKYITDKNGANPAKLMADYLDVGAGPGTAGVPKATVLASVIDLSYPTFADCVFSDDVNGFAFPCPHIDFATFLVFSYFFTPTTFNVVSSFSPATNFDVKAYVQYVKDS